MNEQLSKIPQLHVLNSRLDTLAAELMHQLYIPELEGSQIHLPSDVAHHVFQVLRVQSGERVSITDGRGQQGEAIILEASKRSVLLQIEELRTIGKERPAAIHIAIAPTKSIDRYEWFLEKATEIGIDRITPLITQHSERKRVRHDRSLKVLIAAMKQSQRSWLPELDELMTLKELVAQDLPKQRAFGWCSGEHRPLMEWYEQQPSLVLIGPEGDFSDEEAELLVSNDFDPISIGNTRLRTETAAVAAVTWMGLVQQS